jgi:anti-repressor protein
MKIAGEILPSIRKYGAYMTPRKIEEILTNPDTIIGLAEALKHEQTKRRELAARAEKDFPKVLFADSVSASKTSILVGELAKLLRQNGVEVGQNRLFEILRNEGYLVRGGSGRNMPTQRSMELGLFEIKEITINRSDGGIDIKKTTKVTGRGYGKQDVMESIVKIRDNKSLSPYFLNITSRLLPVLFTPLLAQAL